MYLGQRVGIEIVVAFLFNWRRFGKVAKEIRRIGINFAKTENTTKKRAALSEKFREGRLFIQELERN